MRRPETPAPDETGEAADGAALTISDIGERTGLPASTIRFYEKEFAGFLKTRKTLGGHRRYSESDLQKFLYIKDLVQTRKLSLKKVREALVAENEPQVLRRDLDLLIDVYHQLTEENERLKQGLTEVARRIARLEEAQSRAAKKGAGGFKLFGEKGR